MGMIRPEYYSDEFSSLYLVAHERNWTPWQFDAMKRLERCEQKGSFKQDIEKTITVIELLKSEYKPSLWAKIRMLFATEPKAVADQRNWNFFVCNICYYLETGRYDLAIVECKKYYNFVTKNNL
jgi:hypothetical protein